MTDDNSNLVDIPEDLKDFKAVLFGTEDQKVEDTGDDTPATDEDTDAPAETGDEEEVQEDSDEETSEDEDESDADDTGDDEDEDEEDKPEEKEKPRKSSYQQRISELTRARREAERREQQLLQRLEALEAETRKPESSPQDVRANLPQGAPKPDAVNDKGDPVYPLGEFDPSFIADLMEFTVEQKTKQLEENRAKEAAARQLAEAQEAIRTDWAAKLDKFEEEVPEVRDHIADLVETFQDVDPGYGEYLAVTIMQSEVGPAIMEYLSQNIGEAQKIVASDPRSATLAIGRLEAKLQNANSRPNAEQRNKKPSAAPTPPARQTRGSKGTTSFRPDTEDLAAFKREFLRK